MLQSVPHSDDGHSMDHGARLDHLGAVLKYRVITVIGNQVLVPLGFTVDGSPWLPTIVACLEALALIGLDRHPFFSGGLPNSS